MKADFAKFKTEIDSACFSEDPINNTLHSYDATNEFHLPAGVVRPRNEFDLQQIIRSANANFIPLVPRGAGTGFSGGALPLNKGGKLCSPSVVIDFLGMNKILELDEDDMVAKVQPGLVTFQFQEYVEQKGFFYPPDPASLKTCTLGGNVAENAGGPRCLKYGLTRDYVLAIDGFTGDGKPFHVGKGVLKNRSGYDLRHILIGSEGTLGVFSSILLKLRPKPEDRILFIAFFDDFNEATGMVNTLLHKGIQPSSMEFMDEFSVRAVERHGKFGLPLNYQALLLIEADGRSDEIPFLKRRIEDSLKVSAKEIRIAIEHYEQEAFWDIRRKTSPALRAFGNKKANEDISVPRKSIPAVIRGLREIADKNRINLINFGHIGDGNIHVNIMYDGKNPDDQFRVNLALTNIASLVNEVHGAISGEHGVGTVKKRFLPGNVDSVSYDLMRAIKKDFDPNGILNPGKMLY
ncbi:FAD-binding protein [bacterium]|nr:FAD-binding protein [bacterium]